MRHTILLSFVAILAVLCVAAGIAASSPGPVHTARPKPTVRLLANDEVLTEAPPDPKLVKLKAYTLGVMRDWPPAKIPAVDYEPLAEDIARAALERGTAAPHEDAVLLAALAYFEGARFAEYVDGGRCNDAAWRATAAARALMRVGGDCDDARAHTLWQVWPTRDRASQLYEVCSAEAIADRATAARCALRIASLDPSLCRYTGERRVCPKAWARLAFARRALAAHPFPS
jgi:hypothetical protein